LALKAVSWRPFLFNISRFGSERTKKNDEFRVRQWGARGAQIAIRGVYSFVGARPPEEPSWETDHERRHSRFILASCLILAACPPLPPSDAAVIYVKPSSIWGGGDGSTAMKAVSGLAAALAYPKAGRTFVS
jgi:hypothetical protein